MSIYSFKTSNVGFKRNLPKRFDIIFIGFKTSNVGFKLMPKDSAPNVLNHQMWIFKPLLESVKPSFFVAF